MKKSVKKKELKFDKPYDEKRPWGKFRQFTHNKKSTVKILTVKPKKRNSLQYHDKRAEFWKVLDNPVKVTVGKKTWNAKKGEEIFIPIKSKHRLQGLSKESNILEISLGNFKENDITRLEDDFGRAE